MAITAPIAVEMKKPTPFSRLCTRKIQEALAAEREEKDEFRRIRYYQNANRFLEAVYRSVSAVLEDLNTLGVAVLKSVFDGPDPPFVSKS
jgi:hypothetical protein